MARREATEEELLKDYGPKLHPTSVEELEALATHLWNQPELRKAFERAGFRGDWTQNEQAKIDAAIADYAEAHFEGLRDHLLLPHAAVVCRFVAGEKLAAPNGEETRAFLEDRHFSRSRKYSGLLTSKTWIDEVILVARDLKDDPVYWGEVKDAGKDRKIDERLSKEVMRPTSRRIAAKYGLTNRSELSVAIVLLRAIAVGEVPDLDDPKAREKVRNSMIPRKRRDV